MVSVPQEFLDAVLRMSFAPLSTSATRLRWENSRLTSRRSKGVGGVCSSGGATSPVPLLPPSPPPHLVCNACSFASHEQMPPVNGQQLSAPHAYYLDVLRRAAASSCSGVSGSSLPE
eukprot:CAMPEP_0174733572 /NCGR_PEP_ID=MMETSP1094-20130205/61593_1 /TAXON_ID=156173 /ORGANISM="Chrysochromulina brevifilum, Strain UTEX LB 985" /LENGTH=116 /DNA_ID=CAMNT_0015936259 /DNA_START=171 /DNA_END=521 /DNA_ORIENTATION=-